MRKCSLSDRLIEKAETGAEIVQMAGEGVEQLETYFGRYLSQFFYFGADYPLLYPLAYQRSNGTAPPTCCASYSYRHYARDACRKKIA